MAIPTDLADINAFTQKLIIPRLIDTVFNDAVLLNMLLARNRVNFEGGTYVQQPLMYGKLAGGAFTRTTATGWNTDYKETDAAVQVAMKYTQVGIRLYGTDDVVNSGREAAFKQVQSKMVNASFTMAELLAKQIYSDGQSSSGDVTTSGGLLSTSASMDGLLAWIDDGNNSGTYTTATDLTKSFTSVGGVVRADLLSSPPAFTGATTPLARLFGTTAYVDRAFNTFTLPKITEVMGNVWHGNKRVDVIVGANAVWNKFSNSMQPILRHTTGDLAVGKSGYRVIEYQGAEVVVDKYCPASVAFGLNLGTIDFYISAKKLFQFGFTGFQKAYDGIDYRGDVLFAGNILCTSPRHNFKLYGSGLA